MIKKALIALLAAAAVAGCSKDQGSESYDSSSNIASFSSQSITRTNDAGTEWEKLDKIGIFSDGFDTDYVNVAYEADKDGATTDFTLVTGEDPILYPNVAETPAKTVDFYAYYPYDEDVVAEGLATIDISDQSDLGAIDFMTALSEDNGYYLKNTYSDVVLNFKHNLSQVKFVMTVNGNVTCLKDLTATITDIATKGTYNAIGANQGTLSGDLSEIKDVTLKVDSNLADDATTTTITAILHPGTYTSASQLNFSLDVNGTTVVYGVPFATTLEAGKSHTFNIALGNVVTGFESGSTIGEWGDGDDGTIYTATPDIIFDSNLNSGTYKIYTAQGLKAFADLVNGTTNTTAITSGSDFASFGTPYSGINGTLMNDIDLSSVCYEGNGSDILDCSWAPIGDNKDTTNGPKYSGIFDGGGYNIRGLYINTTAIGCQGLFGYISGATIRDLGIIGGSVTGSGYNVGGVVGCADSSDITDCYNTGDITGNASVGGIAGQVTSDTASTYEVSNCYNTGDIKSNIANGNVGGIVGTATKYLVTECYNTGYVSGTTNIGGVVGVAYDTSTVSDCYNTGDVECIGSNVGGVVGAVNSSSSITSCYSCGTVSGGSSGYIGGAVGRIMDSGSSIITYCYYDTETVGDTNNPTTAVGGETSGTADDTVNNVTGLTTADMKDSSKLLVDLESGVSGSTNWEVDTEINSGYPILVWQTSGN